MMNQPSPKHHRHSIRLNGYDYRTPGAYFVTLCTDRRLHLFGEVEKENMVLNQAGAAVWEAWRALEKHNSLIELAACVVMPNHIHGIIIIHEHTAVSSDTPVNHRSEVPVNIIENIFPVRSKGPAKGALGAIIGQFKSQATRRIWKLPGYSRIPVWQRNYYEHIIRNENEWAQITDYIHTNPARWTEDQLYSNK